MELTCVFLLEQHSALNLIAIQIPAPRLFLTLPLLFILAGNKSDLETQRQVLFEDACTLAENNSVLAALETSAKEAQNVEAAFTLMARELLARNGMTIIDESSQDSSQFMLSNSSHPIHGTASSDKKCGC